MLHYLLSITTLFSPCKDTQLFLCNHQHLDQSLLHFIWVCLIFQIICLFSSLNLGFSLAAGLLDLRTAKASALLLLCSSGMRNWPRASFLRPFSGFFQQLLTTSFSAAFCGHEKRKENWHGTWTNDVFNTTSCALFPYYSRAQPLSYSISFLIPQKSVKKGNTKVLCSSSSTFPTINLSKDSKQNFHLVTQKSTQKCSCLVRQDEDETLREIQSSPTQKILYCFIAESASQQAFLCLVFRVEK